MFTVVVVLSFYSVTYAAVNPDSLILQMDFNSITDISGKQTLSIIGSDRTVTDGVCGTGNKCYNVGISNNGIDMGAPLLTNNTDWTIAFEGYIPTGSNAYNSFVSQYATGAAGRFFVGKELTTNKYLVRVGSTSAVSADVVSGRDGWHQWVAVKEGTAYRLIIDGAEVINTTIAEPIMSTVNTILGLNGTGVSASYIDDLYIFNNAYTYNEVEEYINSALSEDVDPDSLILRMNFTTINDLTGKQSVSLVGNNNTVNGGVCGIGNKCYDVGYINNGINLGGPLLSSMDWTIAFDGLIPTSTSTGYSPFVSQYSTTDGGRFYVGRDLVSDKYALRVGSTNALSSDVVTERDGWKHWVVSKQGTNYIVTVDGVTKINTTIATAISALNTVVGINGALADHSYIDNLYIFNEAYGYDTTRTYINSIPEVAEISLTSPSNNKLYQRNDIGVSDVTVSGSVSGVSSPVDIEMSYKGAPWVTIATDITDTFSYTTSFPIGMGELVVRIVEQPIASDSVMFGVGDIYLLIGQSNQDGRATNLNTSHAVNDIRGVMFQQANRCEYYITSNPVNGSWKINNDPTGNGNVSGCGNYGSQWPLVANSLISDYEIPIGWIPATYGATSITSWQKGQVNYDRAIQLVEQATDGANKIKGVLWHQGEQDGGQTESWYYSRLNNLITSLQQDLEFEKILVGIVSRSDGTYGGGLAGGVQSAQHAIVHDLSIAYLGPESYDIPTSVDGLHYKTVDEITEFARRWYIHIAKEFYDRPITYPELVGYYKYAADTIAVKVNQPVEISTFLRQSGSKAFGFKIVNNGSVVTDYDTTLIQENGVQLVLIHIAEEVVEDTLSITYAETNSGYNKTILRAVDSGLPVVRSYNLSVIEPPVVDSDPEPETPRPRVVGGSYVPGTTTPYVMPVSTDTTACRPGDLFSIATGARCSSSISAPSTPRTVPTFTRSLSFGMTGEDVRALQHYLNNNGFLVALTGAGSKGFETTYFGPATRAAVVKFQLANKITPAVGFFGPITREYIK